MKKIFYSLSIILFFTGAKAQFYDNFSDGDLRYNPLWKGDIEDFVTNIHYQLQLDAYEPGTSVLYTDYLFLDSLEAGIFFKLDFPPSNANKLRIYIMADTMDLDKVSGYFLEIGENGNEDKIRFYKVDNGTEILLATGTPGIFAGQPATASLKITKSRDGIWQIFVKGDQCYFQKEIEIFDDDFNFERNYFLLQCKYTNARKNKFFFDDIYVKIPEKDISPPLLCRATIKGDSTLLLAFDEPVREGAIFDPANYTLKEQGFHPEHITLDKDNMANVLLTFKNKFESGKIYTISVKNISDLYGNKIIKPQEKQFYITNTPAKGDLVINEILFNPLPGGSDFLELVNTSRKFLNLKGLYIANTLKEKGYTLNKTTVLKPGSYICITPDTSGIINDYFIPDTAFLIQNKLPSFDNDTGNVTIYSYDFANHKKIMVDSFVYSENMHNSFLQDVEGISLERKNPLDETNIRFNWTSASTQEGGATPGYKNSSFYVASKRNLKKHFTLANKVFAPGQGGYPNELEIEYKFENSNNLANIYIFDSKGRYIYTLVNNETLGTQGVINWNGLIDGKKPSPGLYLLYCEAINEKGKSIVEKKVFVLAEKLK